MTSGIDLSAFCNQGFSDSPENMVRKEFWKFPLNDIIRGIPFIFVDPQKNGGKSTIMLKGRHRKELPESVKGIPVNKVVKRLFFLHGCCYNSDNGKVMTYRLNFADGQVRELDIYAGIGTGEWKIAPGGKGLAEVSNARTPTSTPASVQVSGAKAQADTSTSGKTTSRKSASPTRTSTSAVLPV